jgi:predicted short-subunit dehydrogenase-like oxidoreductase (DUF2520 family)
VARQGCTDLPDTSDIDFPPRRHYCRTVSTSAAPLAGLRFSLVGPGRVGSSLAGWAVAAGAEQAAVTGRAGLARLSSAGQELLLIAVPDGALAEVAGRLAARPQAAVALHASGSQDAGVLAPLRAAGSSPGTLHPLKAFPRPMPEPEQARGVFFALDGDPAALLLARRLVTAWDGVAGEVPAAARPIYHFAATLAAGGVATLLAAAAELAARAGLPPAVGEGYLELARGTVAAAMPAAAGGGAGGAAEALTGPVARGDLATFELHVAALRAIAPERVPLALELAREMLRQLAGRRRTGAGHEALEAWIDAISGCTGLPAPKPPGQ